MKKYIILILLIGFMTTGCAVQKQVEIQNTLARIAGRNLGYRMEQAKAMVNSQIVANPVMSADLQDLIPLFEPSPGLFNTDLDKAAAEGFADGVRIFQAGTVNIATNPFLKIVQDREKEKGRTN
jgi:hypothetical protein